MLASLYETLSNTKPKHTIVFAGFSDGEKASSGSDFYIKTMPQRDRSRIVGMVNLESLGLARLKYEIAGADKELVSLLKSVATSADSYVDTTNLEILTKSDSRVFQAAHIPVITLTSIGPETAKIIHSGKDRLNAIRPQDYFDTYRLIVLFLAELDQRAPAPQVAGDVTGH
jgi:hypothetical protein